MPIRLSRHFLALAAAATIGPVLVTLFIAACMVVAGVSKSEIAALAVWMFLGVMLVAAPMAAVVLSLLWPVVRRGTIAGRWVCMVAGFSLGIFLAPMSSKGMQGASVKQMAVFAVSGLLVTAVYCMTLGWLCRRRRDTQRLEAVFA